MRLLRHSVLYLMARAVPALLSVASLVVFTRLLNPQEYGLYILIAAGASLADAVLMQWMYWAIVRFSSDDTETPEAVNQSLINAFYGILVIGGIAGVVASFLFTSTIQPVLIWAGYLFFATHGWYSLHLQTARADLRPGHFGLLEGLRSVLGFAAALLFILLGWGAAGLLLGLSIGRILPTLFYPQRRWYAFPAKGGAMRKILKFGLPLGISTALGFVINLSDRIIIGAMLGEAAAGLYGAGYDLVLRAMVALMTVLNLASYPLVVKSLEEGGRERAIELLRSYFTLFLIVAGGFALGLGLLSEELANLLLGESFREAAIKLIPVAALGVFLSGLRSFYFNYSFQLSKRTIDQLWVTLPPALLDILLVIRWVPEYGIQGAIYASALSFGLALLLSILLGRRGFVMPVPGWDTIKTAGILSVWSGVLIVTSSWEGIPLLILRLMLGLLGAGSVFMATNPAGMRTALIRAIQRQAGGRTDG